MLGWNPIPKSLPERGHAVTRVLITTALLLLTAAATAAPASGQDAKRCVNFTASTEPYSHFYIVENVCNQDIVVSACLVNAPVMRCGNSSDYYTSNWRLDSGDTMTWSDGESRYRYAACIDHPDVYGELDASPDGRYGCRTPD